jgi:D-alanyl-D-alanine carboxypeptidase/D-alanyl-D-alanine-endopeptidase (penicillin-binding protein 4)
MPSSGNAIAAALAAGVLLVPQPAPAATGTDLRKAEAALSSRLASEMRAAGRFSGARVVNLTDGRPVFRWRQSTPRTLASNTKLFTTAASLARFGTEGTLGTEVLGRGQLEEDGVWRGDLYLRGGGDPTFGSSGFTRRAYGSRATVDALAAALDELGVRRVSGRVVGDESRFDSLRGGPDSGYGTSIWVGPLSALAYNRGLADEHGRSFQTNPPLFAAARLDHALERRGVRVQRAPAVGRTPAGSEVLASVDSPPMERLVRITNKGSDNFFAEMLLKGLARQASGRGTTAGGARLVARFARRLGAPAHLVDGSGLSRANRASPARVVRLLSAMEDRDEFDAFLDSLPIAGRDGTLRDRIRGGPAHDRCSAKTGTLSNVSVLSGYCESRSGDLYAFSILMNAVYPVGARRIQDRMVQAIAAIEL